MKFSKRVTAALVSGMLFLGIFAGCAQSELKPYEPDESATPNPLESAAAEPDPDAGEDYSYAFEKYDPDELVMMVNDVPVAWREYFYWLFYMYSSTFLSYGEEPDWDEPCYYDPEMTNSEFIVSQAEKNLVPFKVVQAEAEKLGVALDDEDMKSVAEEWDSYVAYYGDEEGFVEMLEEIFLTREIYMEYLEMGYLYPKCFNEIYGEDGEKCEDDEVYDYIENNGYYGVKHILISTLDENREELSEEEKAEKLTVAQGLLDQIAASGDLETTFTELMNEHSEDPGLEPYPDGYCFGQDDLPGLDPAFKDALIGLEEMEYSGIVDGASGYHILLRIPVTPDTKVDYKDYYSMELFDMRYKAASDRFESLVESWAEDAVVKYESKFKGLNLKDIF